MVRKKIENCMLGDGNLVKQSRYVFRTSLFRSIYIDKHIYRCQSCSLRQANVKKIDEAALTDYYRAHYRQVAKIAVAESQSSHAYFRARGVALADLVSNQPRTAFELGSGYGYNLLALSNRFPGIRLFTDEIDTSIQLAYKVESSTLSEGPYDVIILSHVLEHFTDPVSLLRKARDGLAKGGVVVIEVPNDVDGIYPLNGPDEPHLMFFTQETLTTVVQASGLTGEIFAAGLPYRKKTAKNRLKHFVRELGRYVPAVKRVLDTRADRIARDFDLGQRHPQGAVLRALLTKR